MPRNQNFSDKKPRYFNAFKFKHQNEKAPKLGILSEDVMSYYRQVSASLENGFDEDDPSVKRDFLDNVYLTLKDEGIQVSQNQTVSRILEVLFTHSAPIHLRGLFGQFCKELTIVSFDRFASHVFQALIQYLPVMYDDEEDKDGKKQLKTWVDQVCQFTESHLRDVMTHTYGSHVLRSLLEVLGGVPVKDEVVRSGVSRKKNVETEKKFVVSEKFSEDYKSWFETLKDKIIRLCNYEDHLSDNNYCPVLQTLLLVLHKTSPTEYMELASTIIAKTCSPEVMDSHEDDVSKRLPLLVQNEVGSYLMELLISLAPEEQMRSLYDDVFKEKIIYFAVHPVSNYVLQKFLSFVSNKDMFLELLEEVCKYLEDILATNHVGIVTKLVEACNKKHLGQDKVMKALMSAFHCDDPVEKQKKFVPLIAAMQTYDVMHPPPESQKKNSGILNSVIIHGSLILQQLVNFDNTKIVAVSLLELSPAELSFLCCDKSGSHIVDAFFQSSSVKEKNKEDFLKKLQGMYVGIACNRNGSRCLENIWKGITVKRKVFIAEELLKGQERVESDQWGHFLYNNFALFKFSQRRKEWMDIQNGILKKQQLLQNILDGNVDKRKKGKNKKKRNLQQLTVEPTETKGTTDIGEEKWGAALIDSPRHPKKRKALEMVKSTGEDDEKPTGKKKKKKNQEALEDTDTKSAKDVTESEPDTEKKEKKRKRKKKKKRIIRREDKKDEIKE